MTVKWENYGKLMSQRKQLAVNRLNCSALRGKDSHEYGVQGQKTEALGVIVRKWPG